MYISSNGENQRNFREVMICNVVFNPFSSRVVLPLNNTPFPRVLEDAYNMRISFYYALLIRTTIISGAYKRTHGDTNMQPLN